MHAGNAGVLSWLILKQEGGNRRGTGIIETNEIYILFYRQSPFLVERYKSTGRYQYNIIIT